MGRLCLYYKPLEETDRWVPGDKYIRPLVRRIIRGPKKIGGVDKVFINLCKGLDLLDIEYKINMKFKELRPDDRVGVLGRGRKCLNGYDKKNPIVAGIALMSHPSEWPTLLDDYPVAKYLQHSSWVSEVYKPYFGESVKIWPVGIDSSHWSPRNPLNEKEIDVLIYDKIMWNKQIVSPVFIDYMKSFLEKQKLTYRVITYGCYNSADFHQILNNSRSMIFLCEHESQGLAYQEALSCGIPILAWDQGICLDPTYTSNNTEIIPASSVPYFDDRCGMKFKSIDEFNSKFIAFWDFVKSGKFNPREYILENLTLEKCAKGFLEQFNDIY